MAIATMTLDPNATSYTDDQIVGKINSASADITRADAVDADALFDGSTNKVFTGTEQTKLTGIEASATADQSGAEIKTAYEGETNAYTDTKDTKLTGIEAGAKDDQTGDEIITAIDAGSSSISRTDSIDMDALDIVTTNPAVGEFKVKKVQRTSDGKLDIDYDDEAIT